MTEHRRRCTACGQTKPLTEFKPLYRNSRKTGEILYRRRCKACSAGYERDRISSSPANYLSSILATRKQWHRNHRNPVPWRFTLADALYLWRKQDGRCAITGTPMTYERDNGGKPTNASLDRIEPAKGYVPGNVRLLCKVVNTMRWDLTDEEFRAWCSRVVNGRP